MAKKKEEKITDEEIKLDEIVDMSLKERLCAIQSSVRAILKDARSGEEGSSFSYEYVSGNKLLGIIRPLMDKYGVLLSTEILEIENKDVKYSVYNRYQKCNVEKFEIMTTIKLLFTWMCIHNEQTISLKFASNGINGFEKGLGSALTYAERYFLLKFFHIPTDEDDVDNSDRKPGEIEETVTTPNTTPKKPKDTDKEKPVELKTVPIPEADRNTLIQMISVEIDNNPKLDYYKILKHYGFGEEKTLVDLGDEQLKDCANKVKVWDKFVEYKKTKK